ncbi:hypothetical protein BKA67DRAFT_594740 [Truncatella angustata]|uniref:Carbohydrate esterase family 16 protein n=1 Tax=Truncatella angustata TaxID=152316 RepID=A0A9P8RLA0_9PEZI|nr:uncharacterized protein BKA67DRAFT_594740 [Truncatella angustata]KAH6647911.1 hypothetical protein BKA67DRAFT_594740 [Truncatella angustata]
MMSFSRVLALAAASSLSFSSVASASTAILSSSSVAASKSSSASAAASTLASEATAGSDGTKYMVVFGDSYSSTGFWITSGYPASGNPMGNGGSTTTGGLNWAGFVTETYNTTEILTYDFAVYGATVDTDLVRGSTPDVKDQVGYFNEYLASKPSYAPWTSDDLLVAVWIGINDVGNPFWDGTASPIDSIMDEYFDLLQNLTDTGVTNFVLLTVPPFNNAPSFIDQGESSLNNLVSNITAYNDALSSRLDTFKTTNTDVTAQVFDTTASFTTALNDPTTYGATDATCSNSDGTTCLWYDGYHAGQAIHKLVAEAFVKALTGSFF